MSDKAKARVIGGGLQRADGSGQTGAYSTVEVGTVETLAPGTPAYVQNAGTQVAAKLNFGIPKGERGEAGLPNLPEIVLTDAQITELITNQHITFTADQYPLIEDLSKPIIHLKVGIVFMILYKADHSNLIELLEFPSSQSMAASGAWAKGLSYSGFMYNKTTHIAYTVGYSIDPDDKTTAMTQSVGVDGNGKLWTTPTDISGKQDKIPTIKIDETQYIEAEDCYLLTDAQSVILVDHNNTQFIIDGDPISSGNVSDLYVKTGQWDSDNEVYLSRARTSGSGSRSEASGFVGDRIYYNPFTKKAIFSSVVISESDISGKEDKATVITQSAPTAITIADNTEYKLTNVSALTLTYPASGSYSAWLRIVTASSGTPTVTFPDDTKYIPAVPSFGTNETWLMYIEDGVVIAQKAVSAS